MSSHLRQKLAIALSILTLPIFALAANAPLKIGVINSITGPESPIGESLTNGFKLAQEDLAKKGTKIEVIWEDDTGKPQTAMSALEKLATRDNVSAIVGPYTSANANAVAKLAERYKVPILIPAAAKEEITKQGYKYVHRLNAPADIYAAVLIDGVIDMSKGAAPKTIALIYENTDFGTSTSKTAKEYAAKKGIKVVADEAYAKGSPDYRSTLNKIKSMNPDLVFMVSYAADAILLMRQSREVGLKPKAFLGAGAGFTTEAFAKEKAISNAVMTSTQWAPDVKWTGSAEFAKAYREKYKMEPTYHAACAYEAMLIMGETVAKAAGDRAKTLDGLKAGSWSGILGDVKFENYDGYTNQNKHEMLVQQINDSKFLSVFPATLATAKPVYPFPGWK